MDPTTLIGKAPATEDPLAWIAMLLSLVVVGLLVWQQRAAGIERKESAARQDAERRESEARQEAALARFGTELAAQRAHDASQVTETHKRIDGLADEVRDLSKSVAACPRP